MQISFHSPSVKAKHLSPAHSCLHRFVFENYPEAPWCVWVGQKENRGGNEPELQTSLPRSRCYDWTQPRFGQTEAEMNGEKIGGSFKFEFNGRANHCILKRLFYDLCMADLMISISDAWKHPHRISALLPISVKCPIISRQQPLMSLCSLCMCSSRCCYWCTSLLISFKLICKHWSIMMMMMMMKPKPHSILWQTDRQTILLIPFGGIAREI